MKNLLEVEIGKTYTVKKIDSTNSELEKFLFTLGCFEGENVTIVSRISDNLVILIKDGKYNIDKNVAKIIFV